MILQIPMTFISSVPKINLRENLAINSKVDLKTCILKQIFLFLMSF